MPKRPVPGSVMLSGWREGEGSCFQRPSDFADPRTGLASRPLDAGLWFKCDRRHGRLDTPRDGKPCMDFVGKRIVFDTVTFVEDGSCATERSIRFYAVRRRSTDAQCCHCENYPRS